MVIAAPVALLAYSRRARAFVSANAQAFFNMGLGTMTCLLALRNISKTDTVNTLQRKSEIEAQAFTALKTKLTSAEWTSTALASSQSTTAPAQALANHIEQEWQSTTQKIQAKLEMEDIQAAIVPNMSKPAVTPAVTTPAAATTPATAPTSPPQPVRKTEEGAVSGWV